MSADDGRVTVIGGGLAGSEAAWQLARRGVPVSLIEMRPTVSSPAHHTGSLAELVCSNSFKSDDPTSAAGCLKRELRAMGSLVMSCADALRVPAGGALAVDRQAFTERITARIESEPLITLSRTEALEIPDTPVIVATGPLTSPGFEPALAAVVDSDRLYFFDAAAPIVEAATLDRSIVFPASRYGRGEGMDYLNAPLDRMEYDRFIDTLLGARRVIDKEFDRRELFAACQPIEEVARTGRDAPRFGALKPVGIIDPRTGERPWAVVQLRAENAAGTAYNLVGFQTNLAWPEQRRVFSMIPGLGDAEFVRYGVMHRNTYVDAPRLLDSTLALRSNPRVRLAGQLTGTEGYTEAAATGLLAAVNLHAALTGGGPVVPPQTSLIGSLVSYATDPATTGYQPMHVNFGLVPPLPDRIRGKRARYAAYSQRAHLDFAAWLSTMTDAFPHEPRDD